MPNFNGEKLATETISRLMLHTQWRGLNQLWFAPPQLHTLVSNQPHPYEQSPLREVILTICRVANGEVDRETTSDAFVGELTEMIQDLMETLYSVPLDSAYHIPPHFWETELGMAVTYARYWLHGDAMITMTEAAMILRGSAENRDLVYVRKLLSGRELTEYRAPKDESPNPQRRTRLLRSEVLAYKEAHDGPGKSD